MNLRTTLFVGALAAAITTTFAANAADDFATILEKAEAEGTVIVRVSNPSSPDTHAALEKAFNERFGTSITVAWLPQSAAQVNPLLITEAAAGIGSIDIAGLGAAEDVQGLMVREVIKPYPWEEVFGKEVPGIGKAMNEVMPGLRGAAFGMIDAVYGIGWNTNLISADDVATTMADLLDPKWSGKVAVNAFFLNPVQSLAYVIGQEEALDYARKLIENRPVLQRGSPAVMQAVSVGQTPIGIITYNGAMTAKKAGQPVDFRLFDDFVMVNPAFIYVPETAPNPNAARLFMAWLATEGAQIAAQHETIPRIGDEGSEVAKLVDAAIAVGAKLAIISSLDEIDEQQALRDDLAKLLSASGN